MFFYETNKIPWTNGYPALFYQKGWEVTKTDVFDFINFFFRDHNIISSINHTFIILIPKKKICDTLTGYRPIGLTNVLYKMITKLLATRLKSLLPNILGEEQGAFIKGQCDCCKRSDSLYEKDQRKEKKGFFGS